MTAYLGDMELSISIHAPREGGDTKEKEAYQQKQDISIHAPREGGDQTVSTLIKAETGFQSTPPARGATHIFV